jgi:hypothetical protein
MVLDFSSTARIGGGGGGYIIRCTKGKSKSAKGDLLPRPALLVGIKWTVLEEPYVVYLLKVIRLYGGSRRV